LPSKTGCDSAAPEGTAKDDPAPEGLEAGSSLAVSMDVHVGSPLVQSEDVVVTSPGLPAVPASSATLEVSDPGTEDLICAARAEISLGVALSMDYNLPLVSKPAPDTASVSALPSDSISISLAFGIFFVLFQPSGECVLTMFYLYQYMISLLTFIFVEYSGLSISLAEVVWSSHS
jgi:hypothetical protein